MTSIIKLEPLSGAMDDSPLCYVLRVDEFHFMLDCGFDSTFDSAYLERLKVWAPHVDAVLLSYPDQQHLGALPFLVAKCGLTCPVYATVPVYRMGQMFLYDWYESYKSLEDFAHFSLDDVDQAFEHIQQVKYSQAVSLKGRGDGLQVEPLPAGHMIGGTIWRISRMGEEQIIYAVDFNHKKERHLNGCSFDTISRPSLLITDSYNIDLNQSRRKDRDELLLTNILQTLRNGGNCLIVVDTAGRVLELTQLLDQLWHSPEAGLLMYALVLMNYVAFNVVEFAKSQVEWMSDKILRSFQRGRSNNPFQFRHMQLCHSLSDLARIRQPKVVLASQLDMESGFSRELFLEWCIEPRNSVILTGRSRQGTLGARLIQMASGDATAMSRKITLEVKRRVPLEGFELDEYWREKKQKKQQATRARLEAQRRITRAEMISERDVSDDDEPEMDVENTSELPYDVMYDYITRMKSQGNRRIKRSEPMFRHSENKIKWDDYGEVIHLEHYAAPEAAQQPIETSALDPVGALKYAESQMLENAEDEVPTKSMRIVQTLEVMCRLEFIEFEGRSDSESIKKILHLCKPKQVVIVHGSPEATETLARHCRRVYNLPSDKVFMPKLGDIVDATIERRLYQVKVSDSVMSSLNFTVAMGIEMAWLDARVRVHDAAKDEVASLQPKPAGLRMLDMGTNTYTLEELAPDEIPPHRTVFVNEPKLSKLKQLFMIHGFQAEFIGSTLLVNNLIAIRKSENGRLLVEGPASEAYFSVRELVYKQFAIL